MTKQFESSLGKKINIGAGKRPIVGFLNFDIIAGDSILYAKANSMPSCSDKSIELIFSNAVFEHLCPNEYLSIFSEWKRILKDDGAIVCLGIPDFKSISRLYVDNILSEEEVYRYALGEIEEHKDIDLFKGQIHKRLFNLDILKNIFEENKFKCLVFNYSYPNEEHKINLGVIAYIAELNDPLKILIKIPSISDYINIQTIKEFK